MQLRFPIRFFACLKFFRVSIPHFNEIVVNFFCLVTNNMNDKRHYFRVRSSLQLFDAFVTLRHEFLPFSCISGFIVIPETE